MRMIIAAALAALLALASGAMAQGKFPNVDTAQDRQDYTWGTRGETGTGAGNQSGENDGTWGYEAPEPERDWYDEVIITVDPDVDYGSGSTTTTTTEVQSDNATITPNTTTTTTTTTEPNE